MPPLLEELLLELLELLEELLELLELLDPPDELLELLPALLPNKIEVLAELIAGVPLL
ncbi:hypothetical protein GCM10027046_18920 [Uliginosibacterium flavum]